jgi:hypothetical protein
MSDKGIVVLEVDSEEGAFLNMGLALLLEMLGSDIENWENKILVSMGADSEDIAEHLREQE